MCDYKQKYEELKQTSDRMKEVLEFIVEHHWLTNGHYWERSFRKWINRFVYLSREALADKKEEGKNEQK